MKKILAVKIRHLGDTALWTAALGALRELPSTEIHLLLPEPYLPLFEKDPRFKKIWPYRDEMRKKLRAENFDTILNFHASPSSAKFCRSIGAKEILIHSHARGKKNDAIPGSGQAFPATERDLNVIRALGWNGKSPATQLEIKRNSPSDSAPILLVPGASRPAKQWPLEKYIALAKALAPHPLLTLIENQNHFRRMAPLLQQLAQLAPLRENLSLKEMLDVVSQSKLFIGSDSGVKHVAAALGIPTLTLFGPESIGEWHCYPSNRHLAIQIPVACRDQDRNPIEFAWCGAYVCPLASHACMNLISADLVKQKALSLLSLNG